ncbi:MAG: ChbG/HpnK family deacetylase [Saprospiraceae bacterium]|nr:ChbG/HpnK family deacetylase [Saprospiraceae bacterium]MDG2419851.1 ChbG/HpnK family deacetylase [Saprospiraceae bacterium]
MVYFQSIFEATKLLFLLISKIEIKKKNLIVTSDDFGVNPSVNDAIINAVNAGKVNSIAVFPNYDGITNKRKKV